MLLDIDIKGNELINKLTEFFTYFLSLLKNLSQILIIFQIVSR